MDKWLRDLGGDYPAADPKAIRCRVNAALDADPMERKRYMRQKIRFAALVTAAVVTLTGTAFAVSPALREVIADLLGDFAPYAQTVTGVSSTDQGIEIKAISAISDRRNIKVFLEVRDVTGSRITGDNLVLGIDEIDRAMGDASNEQVSYGFGGRCVGYEEETGIALYEFSLTHINPLYYVNAPITLKISSVRPGLQDKNYAPLPPGLPAENTLASQTLPTGETVLVPEQTPVKLENMSGVSLSSVGFASDGLLHIQVKMPENALEEYNRVDATIWKPTDDPNQSRIYYDDHTDLQFRVVDALYKDITYPITAEDLSDIHIEDISGSFRTIPQIDGSWSIIVPIEELPERKVAMEEQLSGTLIKELSFTALSAAAVTEKAPNAETEKYRIDNPQLTLYFRDGTHQVMGKQWTFRQPIDPQQIVAVALNQWYIPFEGDTGGPGHWLDALPE